MVVAHAGFCLLSTSHVGRARKAEKKVSSDSGVSEEHGMPPWTESRASPPKSSALQLPIGATNSLVTLSGLR